MKDSFFSIIVPVAKETYLSDAIQSVVYQKKSDFTFELIIINDINSDTVTKIVQGFRNNYPSLNIKYFINKKNEGNVYPTKTWNQGLSHAEGEYTILLGDDDLLGIGYLKEVKRLIGQFPKATLFRTKLMEIDKNGKYIRIGWNNVLKESWIEYIYYRNKYSRPQSTSEFIAKTDALKNMGGYVQHANAWGSDEATWISLAKKSGFVISTNKVFAAWRRHSESISMGEISKEMYITLIELMDWEEQLLVKEKSTFKNSIIYNLGIKSIKERTELIKKEIENRRTINNKLKKVLRKLKII